MKLKDFLKDRLVTIILLALGIITIEIFLLIYPIDIIIRVYIAVVIFVLYFIGILIEYIIRRKFYNNLIETLEELEEKYLIAEIIKSSGFTESKILKNIIEQVDKSMIENVNKYKYLQEDYKDYIELWIHEIKLPIATSKMIVENNKTEATKRIDEELDKVESYTEQALFYARSSTVEKDYYIRKCDLKSIVNESIRKNKNALIQNKITVNLHDLDVSVNTDTKWIIFIMSQIIQNSIKYKKQNTPIIEIYAEKEKERVILYIKDNGIGIKNEELARVFEKGFTGTNGRKSNKKSTGIGLYLCKKLCDKLGIGIDINSKEGIETEIQIIFPQNSHFETID